MSAERQGELVIISGPSGAGKTTVIRRLVERCQLPLVLSISATTRPPRPGEQDGVDYYFLTGDAFQKKRQAGDFLECCEVFGRGHWYGTLREEVTSSLEQGKWVILEIDVQGAITVMEQCRDAITVFVRPATNEELERRLRGRGTETEETVQRRLDVARHELTFASRYQYEVINHTVDQSVHDICRILTQRGE